MRKTGQWDEYKGQLKCTLQLADLHWLPHYDINISFLFLLYHQIIFFSAFMYAFSYISKPYTHFKVFNLVTFFTHSLTHTSYILTIYLYIAPHHSCSTVKSLCRQRLTLLQKIQIIKTLFHADIIDVYTDRKLIQTVWVSETESNRCAVIVDVC